MHELRGLQVRVTKQSQSVNVRGVEYPSYTAASKALGVCRQAVANAVERGRLDGLGLGPVAAHKKRIAIKSEKFPRWRDFRIG